MKRNVLFLAGMLYLGLAGTATAALIDFRIAPFNTCTPANSCTRTVGGVQVTIEGWTDVNNDNALDPMVDAPAALWWDNLDGFGVQSNIGYEPDEIDGPEFLIVRFGTTQSLSQLLITDLFYEGSPQYREIGYYRVTVGGSTGPLVQFLADTSQVPGSTNGELTITLPNSPADNVTFTAPGVQGAQGHEHSVAGVNATALSANLSITKTDAPDPVLLGQNLTYTITVNNAGPNSAYGVTVADTLPAGVTFVSSTPSQGTCSGTSTVTCPLGTLANGASATVTIVVTPTTTGSKSNTATVTSTTADPNTANNSSTATTAVDPAANLSIVKTDAPDPVFVGQNLTYTIIVTNNGPSSAAAVTVTDTLPAGATYVSATPSTGSCTGTSTVSCNLGTLANAASATVTIVVTPTTAGTLNNTASVSSTTGDPNMGNNSSSTSTTVNPSANLSITKTDAPDPVFVGQNLVYTVTVTNNGPSSASSVSVVDTLPGSVTFVSATSSQGSCSPSSGTVTCTIGTMANAAVVTITITVTPTATGTISNSASVSSTTNDPVPGNNTAGPVNTMVNGSADLSITKTDSPDPVLVGQNLTYTITVTNNGPTSAAAVTVTDTLPGGVTFVSATPSQGTCSGTSTVTCNLGSLAFPGSATVTIVVTPTTAGPLSNTASVASSTSDPNNGNNSSTTGTTVNAPSANLSITKNDSPDPVTAGNQLTYSISVTNLGPDAASNVTVTDTLPGSVTWVSSTPSQGSCSGTSTVTCNLGSIPFPGSATVTIVVTPTVAGPLSNTATVSSSTNDPTPGNNSDTETTTVDPPTPTTADLSITKSDNPDPVLVVGANVTYTIVVTNNGPATATGLTITDTLPTGVNFVSAVGPPGSCGTPSGGVFTCTRSSLAVSATWTVTVVVQTITAGVIANTASVSAAETDPNLANNIAIETTNVGDVSRLINISTRGFVGTGSDVMIGGFILGGNLPKQLLLRGFGPTLSTFGVPGPLLANPTMELYWDHDSNPNTAAILIASNNDWGTPVTLCNSPAVCGTPADISATGMSANSYAPSNPNRALDAALLATLQPGTYTVNLSGVSGGTGVGLMGVDDPDGSTLPKLVNISTRGRVQTGSQIMIGGFIIGSGTGNKQVLLRAFGPTLATFGVIGSLANPVLELYADHDSNPLTNAILVATNDDYQTPITQCNAPAVCGTPTEIVATGMAACEDYAVGFSNCGLDSAILATLPPGAYTVNVRGFNNLTGVGLVGIDELGP